MSNLGNMAAPFLVTVAGEIGVKGVLIGGIICIAGGISMLLVKETKPLTEKEKEALSSQGSPSKGDQIT